jgi:3-hydroxyisobutyrate dehydrogenase-like beta-hydroxyacid dehydrogenase
LTLSNRRTISSDATSSALSKLDKIERDAFDPDFSLALASKDLHLALDAANREYRPLPVAQSIAAQWESALKAGLGDRDVIGAYLALTSSNT